MDKITGSLLESVPRFILNDRNGYAIAKTMDVLVTRLCRDIEAADVCLTDPENMPEWALDEYAYGLGLTWYDKTADIEVKRKWILEAHTMRYCIGTKDAIHYLLSGFYDDCEVEEYWQYDGEPYHFRVSVSGEWTAANEKWTRNVLRYVKNLRSILDDIAVGSGTVIRVSGEGSVIGGFMYGLTSGERMTGTQPHISTIARLADAALNIDAQQTRGHVFPYPLAGTRPQENTVGALADSQSGTIADGQASAFSYTPCAETELCGEDSL